jgi:hypothetical protein
MPKTPAYKRGKYKKKAKGSTGVVMNGGGNFKAVKKISVPFVAKLLTKSTYNFVRYGEAQQISYDPLSGNGFAYTFQLSDVVNYSEFTQLFDSYRLMKVELTFRPHITNVVTQHDSTTNTSFRVPEIMMYRDMDGLGATQTEAQVRQRQDAVIKLATKPITIALVPQVAQEVYRSLTTSAYSVPYKNLWLDCSSESVPHWGIRGLITPVGTALAPNFNYTIDVRYWIQFRKVI